MVSKARKFYTNFRDDAVTSTLSNQAVTAVAGKATFLKGFLEYCFAPGAIDDQVMGLSVQLRRNGDALQSQSLSSAQEPFPKPKDILFATLVTYGLIAGDPGSIKGTHEIKTSRSLDEGDVIEMVAIGDSASDAGRIVASLTSFWIGDIG